MRLGTIERVVSRPEDLPHDIAVIRLHELAERGRDLATRCRRAHRCELRDQGADEFLDSVARETDALMAALVCPPAARLAEARQGARRGRRVLLEVRRTSARAVFKRSPR